MNPFQKLTSENIRGFFLIVLFISIPFSIAGDDFAIIGLYLVTLYRLFRGQDRLTSMPIMAGMGLMFAGALISSLFTGDILLSLGYFRNFWRLGLPFLIFLALQDRPCDLHLRILAIVTSIIAVYAVIQYFTGLDVLRSAARQAEYQGHWGTWHAVGVFSHHLTFGGVFLLLFALFLPRGISRGLKAGDRLLFFFASSSAMVAAAASLGRSIWFGIIAAVGVTVLVYLGRKRSLILAIVVVLLAGGIYVSEGTGKKSFFRSTYLGQRILSISLKANRDRIMMWTAAAQAIGDYPILGLGPNRQDRLQPYYDQLRRKEGHHFQHQAHVGVHNIYLQNWVDFGFLGMLGYLIWWGTLLAQILKALQRGDVKEKPTALLVGCLAGLTGVMVAGVFENNFRDGEVQTTILVVMGLALVMLGRQTKKSTGKP